MKKVTVTVAEMRMIAENLGAIDRELIEAAANEFERLRWCRTVLDQIDTTLQVHGHVDANTDLHKRAQDALGATA